MVEVLNMKESESELMDSSKSRVVELFVAGADINIGDNKNDDLELGSILISEDDKRIALIVRDSISEKYGIPALRMSLVLLMDKALDDERSKNPISAFVVNKNQFLSSKERTNFTLTFREIFHNTDISMVISESTPKTEA